MEISHLIHKLHYDVGVIVLLWQQRADINLYYIVKGVCPGKLLSPLRDLGGKNQISNSLFSRNFGIFVI